MGSTQEEAFEEFLQKVSGVDSASSSDPIFAELSRDDRIDVLKSVFENEGIEILEPTSIQVPLSFNEGEMFFYTENEREETEVFLTQFINDFVKPRTDRIFMWEEENRFNIGTIVVKDNIPEMHFVTVEVGA